MQGLRPVALPSLLEDGWSCSLAVTLHWTRGFRLLQVGSFRVSRPGQGQEAPAFQGHRGSKSATQVFGGSDTPTLAFRKSEQEWGLPP